MTKLFKVLVLEKPNQALIGEIETYWVIADSIKQVGEKYPKAQEIKLITDKLITLK